MKTNIFRATVIGLCFFVSTALTACSSKNEAVLWNATPSISIWHSTQYSMTHDYKLFNPDSANCLDIELVYSLKDLRIDEEADSFWSTLKLQDASGRYSQVDFGTTYYLFDSGPTGRGYSPMTSPMIYTEKSVRLKEGTLYAAICAPAGKYRFVLENRWSGSTAKSQEITIR